MLSWNAVGDLALQSSRKPHRVGQGSSGQHLAPAGLTEAIGILGRVRIHMAQDEEAQHEVFISYAAEDREIAERLHDALAAEGITAWYYQGRERRLSQRLPRRLAEAIHTCTIFVLIYSVHAELSEYIELEHALAKRRGKLLFHLELVDVAVVVIGTGLCLSLGTENRYEAWRDAAALSMLVHDVKLMLRQKSEQHAPDEAPAELLAFPDVALSDDAWPVERMMGEAIRHAAEHLSQGQFEPAVDLLATAYRSEPAMSADAYAYVLLRRGQERLRAGRRAEAKADFEAGLALAHTSAAYRAALQSALRDAAGPG